MPSPCGCGGCGCEICGGSGQVESGRGGEYSDEYSNWTRPPSQSSPPPKTMEEELDEVLVALYDYVQNKESDSDKLERLLTKYKMLTGKDKPAFM